MTVTRVQGLCPSCGAHSLFLGENGYVTCSVIGCKDPGAAHDALTPSPSPPSTVAIDHRTLTPATVDAVLRRWQHALRLDQWDLDVHIVRRPEMQSPSAVAMTRVALYRQAVIRLLDPIDFTADDWPNDRDMERSLVHELVHLHLEDCRVREKDTTGQMTPEYTALERGIETIAETLVTLARDAARI